MKVALVFNLKSGSVIREHEAEWDCEETIRAVFNALSTRHDVTRVPADRNLYRNLESSNADIIFNLAEGSYGRNRESHVPSIAEYLGIPYTGSDPLTLGLCLDKVRTKEILSIHQIASPRYGVVHPEDKGIAWKGPFPVIVKPAWQGSSMGIHNDSWIEDQRHLTQKITMLRKKNREPLLVEVALTGSEYTVALIGNGRGVSVLPIVEVLLDVLPKGANPLYSYEAKWVWDVENKPLNIFQCPPRLSVRLKNDIEDLARKAFIALECRDWCRIDIRLDTKKRPHILELNPLPGILPQPEQNSCFPKAARAAGLSYEEMVLKILNTAVARWGLLKKMMKRPDERRPGLTRARALAGISQGYDYRGEIS